MKRKGNAGELNISEERHQMIKEYLSGEYTPNREIWYKYTGQP